MDRVARWLRWLAILVVLAGVVCVYLIHRPSDLASIGRTLSFFAGTASQDPVIWGALLVAVLSTLAARLAETPGATSPRRAEAPQTLELAAEAPVALDLEARGDLAKRLGKHLERRPNVPAFVDTLLSAAVVAQASDIHIQPLDHETRVALRLGGELEDVVAVGAHHHDLIVRRLKILGDLATFQTDMPQDGRLTLDLDNGSVDVRVSVLPTRHGEKVVLRLARAGLGLLTLDRLGMPEPVLTSLRELLSLPQGLIVLTGPTGSGKTSTLYAALAHIHEERGATAAIATLEDPVEIDLPYLSQTQIDSAAGLSFSESLRAVLRQDPDVLMVGEIRDRETAHIAVEAGMTGHLILTTLHADSAAGVFNRLIDLGVEPHLVASSVVATMSQRLARRLCGECRQSAKSRGASATQLVRRGITKTAALSLSYFESPGCDACEQRGTQGRAAIFELLRLTPELRSKVTEKISTPELEEAAVAAGMTPLLKAAVLEAVEGKVSLDEAMRVVG